MPTAPEGRASCATDADAPRADESIDHVWRQYKRQGDEATRTRLIVHYMQTHVRKLAERLYSSLPQQVELEDLVQQGYLGLVDSIDRFELDRNVRFETFSTRRVFGAMRDYLRELDPLPRLARSRAKRLDAVAEEYFKTHGRPPSDELLEEQLMLPREKFRQLLARAKPPSAGASPPTRPDAEGPSDNDLDALPDHSQPTPLGDAERQDLRRWVTCGLSRRDHLIIVLYYYEQMTMREVGQTLGISESRVSQRLDSILQCLRSRMCFQGAAQEFV